MNKAYRSALIRGAIGGFFLAGGTFFSSAPLVGPENAFYAAGALFFGYMATRFSETVVTGDAKKPPQEDGE